MDDRRRALAGAYELAAGFLDTLEDRPVWPRATYEQMLKALGGAFPDRGCDSLEVVQDLARRADPANPSSGPPPQDQS